MAAQAGPNPATPVSSVAASTARAASSVAVSSAAASAASSNAPVASSAAGQSQAASSAAASSVASSVAATSAAASSSAAASVPASSASLAASSSSAIASSSSSSASASRTTKASIASAEASTTSASSGLSGGAIGGIVGGVVGGLVLLGLLWMLLRRRKEKKNRVPPPPPRDFREMTFNGSARPRMNSNNMMSASHRASSYSTLLQNGRPSSQYPSASRSPSYYQTYPVATPSTLPDSPPMPASISTESPTGSSGHGHGTPVMKPVLAPLNTGLRRDNSDSSTDQEFGVLPKHKSSIDRLRYEGSERAPSPASFSMNGDASSRATSPHPSMYGLPSPSTFPRHQFNQDGSYPRPLSMTSISSRAQSQSGRYLQPHAPHGGRVIQPQMPKPLGARPDSSGDFFWATPKPPAGFDVGFDGGQNRRMSRAASELEMYQTGGSYNHDRMPSSQSSKSTLAKPPRVHHTNSSDSQRQAHHSQSMQSMRSAR